MWACPASCMSVFDAAPPADGVPALQQGQWKISAKVWREKAARQTAAATQQDREKSHLHNSHHLKYFKSRAQQLEGKTRSGEEENR